MKNIPLVLTILDGWGLREDPAGNAIALADLPNYRDLWAAYPTTSLRCSGEDVGLPQGQMGNSEVGHLNIGAGRIVYQDLTRISRAIKDGSFFRNPELVKAMAHVRDKGTRLHLMGLVSDGGVHSHLEHVYALLTMAKEWGLSQVFVHAFLDGRDVSPTSGLGYVQALEEKCREIGVGRIATVMGRYYAMDRDKRWERVERAYRALVLGEGKRAARAPEAVAESYEAGVTDEFVEPVVLVDEAGEPLVTIDRDDAIICFNFRADRVRQITRAFVDEDFPWFNRPKGYFPVYYLCMTEYDVTIKAPVAFGPENLENTLGQVLAKAGLRQLRIAETEKYAHVTFFFNGGVEAPNEGEDRILIPSPKVATYDLKPEMSAFDVTDRLLQELEKDVYQVVILNYANPDMVGHTGVLEAAVKAVEAVDHCLGRVRRAVQAKGGVMIVTADHGNAEMMVDPETGGPHTAHTSSLVPFILVADEYRGARLRPGSLQDIAPTMLELIGLPKPAEMTGESLILK